MKKMNRLAALAALAALAPGCVADFGKAAFSCTSDVECPNGYQCVDGCCGGGCPPPPPCVSTLAGVGRGDFTASATATALSKKEAALLFQRSACSSGDWWDMQLTAAGHLKFKLSDSSGSYAVATTAVAVVGTHRLSARRRSGVLTLYVDGAALASAPSTQDLRELPPLGVARGNPCVADFEGSVTTTCLSVP